MEKATTQEATMDWTVKTKLSRGDIAQIVDALAEERDHTGAAPSALEDRLSNLLHSCDKQIAARKAARS